MGNHIFLDHNPADIDSPAGIDLLFHELAHSALSDRDPSAISSRPHVLLQPQNSEETPVTEELQKLIVLGFRQIHDGERAQMEFDRDLRGAGETDFLKGLAAWTTAGVSGFFGGVGWNPPGPEIWEEATRFLLLAQRYLHTDPPLLEEAAIAIEAGFEFIVIARTEWNDWVAAAGLGAERTRKYGLVPAKYAGMAAASYLTGGLASGSGVLGGAAISGAGGAFYGGAQELGTQTGEVLAGSRAQFDLWKAGEVAVKDFVKGFVGSCVSGYLEPYFTDWFREAIRHELANQLQVAASEVPAEILQDFTAKVMGWIVSSSGQILLQGMMEDFFRNIDPETFGEPQDALRSFGDEHWGVLWSQLGSEFGPSVDELLEALAVRLI